MKSDHYKSGENERVNLLPKLDLEFKWRGKTEVIPQNSKVIIKVARKRDLNKIALDVIESYVGRLMFPLNPFVDQSVNVALRYFVIRQMVMELDKKLHPDSRSLLNLFYYESPISRVANSPSIGRVYALEEISSKGLLEVLLTVYWEFYKRIQHNLPHDFILKESLDIFDFVASIATKSPEKEANLVFKGRVVSLAVVLIEVKSERFIEYYRRLIQGYSNKGIELIFLLGAGLPNCQGAKMIAEDFAGRNCEEWKKLTPIETEILSWNRRRAKSTRILIRRVHKSTLRKYK